VSRLALAAVVALSGASVLVLEILGTRVLGPYYGVSLFLWSALIAVTLAALAAGYALGGRLADRSSGSGRLAALLALAGAWVLATPWLRGPVTHATAGLGLRGEVLASAALLFFPPLLLLGAVSPFAIRLSLRSLEQVGRTSGAVFALSTLASLAAALLTGFVLIPVLGVDRLLMLVAVALFAAAGLARVGGAVALLVLALAGGAGALAARAAPAPLTPGVLARRDSPYAELRVVESKGFRYLLVDGAVHDVINAETFEPRQAYVPVAEIMADLVPGHGRLLMIGMGAGLTAGVFARRNWKVDAVEIDPDVPALASQWFHFRPFHADVFVEDGRRFLRRSRTAYDAIFLDAYGGASIPFHLTTREAFAEARARLRPGGVLALNVETVGWQDPLAHALAATLRTQFRNVIALPTAEPPNQPGNVVLMASDRPLELQRESLGDPVISLEDDDEHFRVLSRLHAWDNQFVPAHGRVLTDDWNPSDLRSEEINRAVRRMTRTVLPDSLLHG
jgi:spermidine synthase